MPAVVPESQRSRVLWSSPIVYLVLGFIAFVTWQVLANVPPSGQWSGFRHAVVARCCLVAADAVLLSRTSVSIDGDALVVRGRLRRRRISAADVRQVSVDRDSVDLWNTFAFLQMPSSPLVSIRLDARWVEDRAALGLRFAVGAHEAVA